ncbi:MAG: hypothetical protein U9Q00_10510 [Synergistota bacterium]|nr:hypothetical protein [Synergistota bacterium]
MSSDPVYECLFYLFDDDEEQYIDKDPDDWDSRDWEDYFGEGEPE